MMSFSRRRIFILTGIVVLIALTCIGLRYGLEDKGIRSKITVKSEIKSWELSINNAYALEKIVEKLNIFDDIGVISSTDSIRVAGIDSLVITLTDKLQTNGIYLDQDKGQIRSFFFKTKNSTGYLTIYFDPLYISDSDFGYAVMEYLYKSSLFPNRSREDIVSFILDNTSKYSLERVPLFSVHNNPESSFLQMFVGDVYAQSCIGNWSCGQSISTCECSIGGSSCGSSGNKCGPLDAGTCSCQTECLQTDFNACSGGESSCSAGTCGDCSVNDGCSWSSPPTPTPSPTEHPTPTPQPLPTTGPGTPVPTTTSCGDYHKKITVLGLGVWPCAVDEIKINTKYWWDTCSGGQEDRCEDRSNWRHGPAWVRVMSEEGGTPTSWKGTQDKDPVKGSTWSQQAIDSDGYFTDYKVFQSNSVGDPAPAKTFNKVNNRIDSSGVMDVWMEDDYGNTEYWSNHFCAGGLADRDVGGFIAGAVVTCNNTEITTRCALVPGTCNAAGPPDPYCALDYDGCIDDLAGDNQCLSGDLGCKELGYHNWLNLILEKQRQPYDTRWSATFWAVNKIGDINQFSPEVWLQPPPGYKCTEYVARRAKADGGTSKAKDFKYGTSTTNPNCRPGTECCRMEYRIDGKGVWSMFTIERDPLVPNCWGMPADQEVILGESVDFNVGFESLQGNLSGSIFRGNVNRPLAQTHTVSGFGEIPGNTNTISTTWTPTTEGTYEFGCRAQNSTLAECLPTALVDRPPRYACLGSAIPGDDTTTTLQITKPDPWYKLKGASLYKNDAIDNFIPVGVQAYDGDDTNQQFLIVRGTSPISREGLVMSGSTISLGPGAKTSTTQWQRQNYTRSVGPYLQNLNSFLEYVKLRKKFKKINNLSEVEANTINILSGNLTINQSNFNDANFNFNTVVYVTGDIVFANRNGQNHTYNPSGRSIAFLTPGTLLIHSDYTKLNGIFIADTLDIFSGGDNTKPLKIDGNLISNTDIDASGLERERTNWKKPSLFIVFDQNMYIDLLPYLSTIVLEGRQIR